MLRPDANNLVGALENSQINLNMARMIHRSMDGPNTNWAVFEKMQQNCQMNERAFLVNLLIYSICIQCQERYRLELLARTANWNREKVF